ncbi:hypothetical protein [Streptomyces sp. NPDC050528]|uniref:hypothetical protein n=1 Tax=Streptomyces sp. NPDC050528 TaxID=3365623 RepID=UPI003799DA1F
MDLDTLRYGNFSQLGEAITDWQQMTKKLADLKKDAENNLKAKADKADWAGLNATVTREFVDKTATEFGDAHTQADSISKILSDTHGELVGYRTQLNNAIDRCAKKHLTVVDTGDGTFVVTQNTRPDWASDPSGKTDTTSQQDIDTLRTEIAHILGKATESDNSAAKVLQLLVDQAEYGFSDAAYADRDSATKAVEAADKLAKMAKDPKKMSLDDITEFNLYLENYHNDALFSEQFAKRLGAKGTLQFWADMAELHAGARGTELARMETLQKNLGLTLATASFSDSDDMQNWKKDVLKERNTNFVTDPSNPMKSPVGALGSQVLSSLMRQGHFDTKFLDDYRSELFKADKGAGESGTNNLWTKGYDQIDLEFGKGNGRDPLEGLFDALSHNPEAATHAFDSKSDLDHMFGTTKYTDRGTSLGHALEAAVTGVPAGDPTQQAAPHSTAQVKIMANIMQAVADPDGGADLVTKQMGASFGHMAAAYMPEISQAFGGPNSGAVFVTNSDAPSGLNRWDTTRFLSAVSQDAAGRASIRYGESIYTGSLLDAHLSDPSLFDGSREQALHDIGRNAGIIEGIVGRSVADADISSDIGSTKDENDAIAQQGEFFKSALSAGVGIGSVALVPATGAGALTGAAGGGFFGGVASMAVDRMVSGKELDVGQAMDEALYRTGRDLSQTQDSVSQQTQWSVDDALKRRHVDLPKQGTDDLIRNSVNEGWESSDSILHDFKQRPTG